MRKKLTINTICGLINQIVVLICGLILPRLILNEYGSEINGLVNSVTSFLDVISLLELGVGAVVQASLYKPLVDNDTKKISQICRYAKHFFRIVGIIFVFYTLAVGCIYSTLSLSNFDFLFTFMLFLAIGISMFAQYYFGIVNQLLLNADQKIYIIFILQSGTVILNTIATFLLIKFHFSIQLVKFSTSLIYLLRPFIMYLYVKKKYNLIKDVPLDKNVLPEKWSGLAQHIASFVLSNTDVIVLTIFSTLSNVSIYSVYYLVIKSLHNLIVSLTSGIQSYYGRIYALGEHDKLNEKFYVFSSLIGSLTTLCYSIAIMLIVPFVSVYTQGVSDADYIQYTFAIVLVISQSVYGYRYCYNILILAMGKFKETQISAILEAVINIVVSIIMVLFFGLIGVAIGTLIALFFRFTYFAIYLYKKCNFKNSLIFYFKQIIFTIILDVFAITITYNIDLLKYVSNYFDWFILALIIGSISLLLGGVCFLIIYYDAAKQIFILLKNTFIAFKKHDK